MFMAVFGLFGAPSSPMAGPVPTVGGCALAYCMIGGAGPGDPSAKPDSDCDGIADSADRCPNDSTNECSDLLSCDRAEGLVTVLSTVATIWGAHSVAFTLVPGGQAPGVALGIAAVLLGVSAFAIGVIYSDC